MTTFLSGMSGEIMEAEHGQVPLSGSSRALRSWHCACRTAHSCPVGRAPGCARELHALLYPLVDIGSDPLRESASRHADEAKNLQLCTIVALYQESSEGSGSTSELLYQPFLC